MLLMAREHAVAETSFLVRRPLDTIGFAGSRLTLRWTFAAAAAATCPGALGTDLNEVAFETQSGQLVVTRETQGYQMALPNRAPEPAILPVEIEESLNLQPQEVHKSRDYMLVYRNEREVEAWPSIEPCSTGSIWAPEASSSRPRARTSTLSPGSSPPKPPSLKIRSRVLPTAPRRPFGQHAWVKPSCTRGSSRNEAVKCIATSFHRTCLSLATPSRTRSEKPSCRRSDPSGVAYFCPFHGVASNHRRRRIPVFPVQGLGLARVVLAHWSRHCEKAHRGQSEAAVAEILEAGCVIPLSAPPTANATRRTRDGPPVGHTHATHQSHPQTDPPHQATGCAGWRR